MFNGNLRTTPNVLFVFDNMDDDLSIVEELLGHDAQDVHVLVVCAGANITTATALRGWGHAPVGAWTDEQAHQFLSSALLPVWGADAIAALRQSPIFRTLVDNHPTKLRWLSSMIQANPSISPQHLLDKLQAAAASGLVDPAFTVVADALVSHCQAGVVELHMSAWMLLLHAARLAPIPIPLDVLRRSMGAEGSDIRAAARTLEQFGLISRQRISQAAGTAELRCLSLGRLAKTALTRYKSKLLSRTASMAITDRDIDMALFTALDHLRFTFRCVSSRKRTLLQWKTQERLLAVHSQTFDRSSIGIHVNPFSSCVGSYGTSDFRDACRVPYAYDADDALNEMMPKVLPEPHPSVACALNNIGILYSALGNHAEALSYAFKALSVVRMVLPQPHADTATMLFNIGIAFSNLGKTIDAREYAYEALLMRRSVLPDWHPDIATSLTNCALIFSRLWPSVRKQSILDEALEALAMRRKVLYEPNDRDIGLSLSLVGVLHVGLGNRREGLRCSLEALEILRNHLSNPPHPDLPNLLFNIGALYYRTTGNKAEALSCALESLEIRRKLFPPLHSDILRSERLVDSIQQSLRIERFLHRILHDIPSALRGICTRTWSQRRVPRLINRDAWTRWVQLNAPGFFAILVAIVAAVAWVFGSSIL